MINKNELKKIEAEIDALRDYLNYAMDECIEVSSLVTDRYDDLYAMYLDCKRQMREGN